jgi:hypothetical protein
MFSARLGINNGHDWVEVTLDGHVLELKFEGRDPTTILVRLSYVDDVRAIAKALSDAATIMDED